MLWRLRRFAGWLVVLRFKCFGWVLAAVWLLRWLRLWVFGYVTLLYLIIVFLRVISVGLCLLFRCLCVCLVGVLRFDLLFYISSRVAGCLGVVAVFWLTVVLRLMLVGWLNVAMVIAVICGLFVVLEFAFVAACWRLLEVCCLRFTLVCC